MRKILFRGKRTDNGEWVYGWLKPFLNAGYIGKDNRMCIQNGIYASDIYEIEPETVGQYTGLNGMDSEAIFEGDIVCFFGMIGTIIQECGAFGIDVRGYIDYDLLESKIPFNNNPNFCFNDNFISLWELWWNYEQDDNLLYEVEVIGNIYDNPELLEK